MWNNTQKGGGTVQMGRAVGKHLHAKANAEVGPLVCAGKVCSQNLAFHTSRPKAPRDQHSICCFQLLPGISMCFCVFRLTTPQIAPLT